jgi:thiol-disulfide isomerase/thioredoxin
VKILTTLTAQSKMRVGHQVERPLNLSVEFKPDCALYCWWTMRPYCDNFGRKLLLLAALLLPAPVFARHAPDPSFKTLDGHTRKLSSLHGQIVVVNFWATWCGPCQEELPRLSQIAASYAGKPVSFVYVSIDNPKDQHKIPAALSRLHVSFDSWVNADTDTLGRFGLGEIVPGTIVLDENGEPVARIMGEAREDDVRKPVDWLLAGRKADPPQPMTRRY